MSAPPLRERVAQAQRLLRKDGAAAVTARLLEHAARRISPLNDARLRVNRDDLLRAAELAAGVAPPAQPLAWRAGEPLKIAWVAAPQRGGGGGFTTLVRLCCSLERAGHRCTVYLHDRHGGSLKRHRDTMRGWWPELQAEIRDTADGIEDAHAIFASSWETAYPVLSSPANGKRFYLVLDFEPSFYPAGSEALLAEATYRFGFHGVTLGCWLAQTLASRYRMTAEHFDFGCDLQRYGLQPGVARSGVCVYARPSTPRRAFELAVAALDIFAARHPQVDIHLYGEPAGRLPFTAREHGMLPPTELNDLYNRCVAGLVLSATNVSLVPHEMLAAGCVPVVNDAEHNRVVLDNPQVVYAPATPFDLAGALSALVSQPADERAAAAEAAAASVRGNSWEDAGATVERIIRNAIPHAAPNTADRTVPDAAGHAAGARDGAPLGAA